jgi:ATP-dependent protease ClpP protease subunit
MLYYRVMFKAPGIMDNLQTTLSCVQSSDTIECTGNHIYFFAAVNRYNVYKLINIIQTKNDEYKKAIDGVKTKIEKSDKYTIEISPTPLTLHICSGGGHFLSSMPAIDAILKSEIPIHTVIDGYAASAATLMSIVGKKRMITPNSFMMIHQLSSGFSGPMNQIEDDYRNCQAFMSKIKELYLKYTNGKLTGEIIDEQLKHDNWWDAQTCISNGLVDDLYK